MHSAVVGLKCSICGLNDIFQSPFSPNIQADFLLTTSKTAYQISRLSKSTTQEVLYEPLIILACIICLSLNQSQFPGNEAVF